MDGGSGSVITWALVLASCAPSDPLSAGLKIGHQGLQAGFGVAEEHSGVRLEKKRGRRLGVLPKGMTPGMWPGMWREARCRLRE